MALEVDSPIVVAGAGKMGGALIWGLLASGLDGASIIVQDPQLPDNAGERFAKAGVTVVAEISDLNKQPAIIVVAVKPQVMDDVFPQLARLAGPDTVVISIAAGKTIASFEKHLAPGIAVVRAMPNTPAAVGRGITACVANDATAESKRQLATTVLSALGAVVWIDDENQMDAVTAVSGSGPAYVFWLTECLAAAGRDAGLPDELAAHLARMTVSGSGELLFRSALSASELRRNVTSPGGTTAAALDVLMADDGLAPLMQRAVEAARKRGRELSR
ncbi:MAG: pyrroline-5-carboxylate reductase [Hyphomicrobium sp.]|nr:pyrroline-5-carboxylate reductase [Hyphomicrobium sp.]